MISKKIFFYVFAAVCLTGCKDRLIQETIWSEWQLQNRSDNTYLFDDNGVCKTGTNPHSDAYNWVMESAEEYTRIKNKKTGNFLCYNIGKNILEIIPADSATLASHWQFGGYDWKHKTNCGWYNLFNRTSSGRYLTVNQKVEMTETDVDTDFSAHWSFIRNKGSELPFIITANSVKEASFLGVREARYVSDHEITSDYHGPGHVWKRKLDISAFPQLKAENHPLLVALYNMALEEMQLDIRPQDSTFQAGALWPDTWTRDAVYSIHLAYNYLLPDISKKTLEKQTLNNPKEALQDTGSGGSWPVSTDRVSWAIAAWEYYLASGNKAWLEDCYTGLSYTAEKDLHVAFDDCIHLFKGETASMDWRTHTYPNWYSNAAIAESYSSGTNALHVFLYDFLAQAGDILGKPRTEIALWSEQAQKVKIALNKNCWMEEKGYYCAYLNPPMEGYFPSSRVGCMSNGLCIVLGVADNEQAKSIASRFPLFPYGAPTLYPAIPDDYAYHNKGIWPVWESYWMLGAHKAGNIAATEHIMKSIVRQGALFLTNKENMTYDTGYDRNTALNSDRQLWSVASYLGMFYRIIFGMELTTKGILFHPAVPEQFFGPFELINFKFRAMNLDIIVKGNGNVVSQVFLNGKSQPLPFILPLDLHGKHQVEIEMKKSGKKDMFTLVKAEEGKCWSPIEPVLTLENDQLVWEQQADCSYWLRNSRENRKVNSPFTIKNNRFGVYNLYSIDRKGLHSDLSNPVIIAPDTYRYEAEDARHNGSFSTVHAGYSGKGFVIDLASKPANLMFDIQIPIGKAGFYALKITGANGHGPDNTYCAIRSVFVDKKDAGTFILEASGDWNKWLDSNYLFLNYLQEGKHTIAICFNPEEKGFDNNMSRNKENANDANIDYLELIKAEPTSR
jgi:hypothetical protein